MAEPKNIRGAKPNPLPPGMDLGARIAADRQREQHAERTNERSLEDILGPGDDRVGLEQERQSYVEQSETQQALANQRKMRETARQLLLPGEEAATERHQESPTREEVPRANRPPMEEEPVSQEQTPYAEANAQNEAEAARAAQFAQARQQAQQEQEKKAKEDKSKKGFNPIQEGQKLLERGRRLGEIGSGVGILLAILELNVQCLLTLLHIDIEKIPGPFFLKMTKATRADMFFCACVDCAACVVPPIGCFLPLVIIIFALGIIGVGINLIPIP